MRTPTQNLEEVTLDRLLDELDDLRQDSAARLEQIERFVRDLDPDGTPLEELVRELCAKLAASEQESTTRLTSAENFARLSGAQVRRLRQEQATRPRLAVAIERQARHLQRGERLSMPVRPKLLRARDLARGIARRLLDSGGLWKFDQYPPRPLVIPENYRRQKRLSYVPKISIVTPSFNSVEFIEETIKSVLSQDYPALEYICQDGASTDGTADVIRRYEDRLHAWNSEPDSGQTNALNKGFAKTSGEILAYLNSDDILLPGAMNYAAAYFDKHPEVDVIYSHRMMINEQGFEVGRWILPPHDDHALKYADYIPQETMFWRRRIFEKVGAALDENFSFAMDWDLILRFQEAGARFVRVPRFLGAFRIHTAQKSQAVISEVGEREMARLRERRLGHAPDHLEINRNLRRYVVRQVLLNYAHEGGLLRP